MYKKAVCVALLAFLLMPAIAHATLSWAYGYLFFSIVPFYETEVTRCYRLDEEMLLCYYNTDDKYIVLKIGDYGEIIEI